MVQINIHSPTRRKAGDSPTDADPCENGVRELGHADFPCLDAHVGWQKVVKGNEGVEGVPRDVNVPERSDRASAFRWEKNRAVPDKPTDARTFHPWALSQTARET